MRAHPTVPHLLVCLVLVLLPWVGVGTAQLLGGRPLGFGLQPSLLVAAALVLWCLPGLLRDLLAPDGRALWIALALGWTVAASTLLWRLDDMGLAGEVAWAKGLKQLLLLAFLMAVLLAPGAVLGGAADPARRLGGWERAAALGLLLGAGYGLLQTIHFTSPLPGMDRLESWVTSNPSIAAGSDQLYLGHRFVGIARARGPACEPLYFGSYLLALMPVTAAGAWTRRGWSRIWRWITVGLAGIALILTFSRGVYLAALVVGAALAAGMVAGRLPRPRPRWVGIGTATAILCLGLGGSLVAGVEPWALPGLLGDRLAQSLAGHDMSNLTRLYSWRAAIDLVVAAPLTGVGWGGYGFHYFDLAGSGGSGAHFGWPVTNNIPLLIAAETGWIGLGLWSVALWPSLRALFRRDPSVSPAEDAWRFLLAATVLGMGVQALTHSQVQLPHLWVVMGVSSALASSRFPVV